MSEIAIKVDHVSKTFKLPHEKNSSLKHLFIGMFRGKRTYEKQVVLDDVNFEIKKGEFFGIVGRNGSGKSTLLKLLAGVYSPNKGAIHINGKLTPFIELGVGFNPELTGRENVYLNGALLGFNRKEMDGMYDEIVEFAELEKFMDQKLKNYSSGMQVRLAFSIAIRARTDILLLDEVLAVGDSAFQQKCYDYFEKLKREKKTVVFVSHDRTALERFCDSGVLIDTGSIILEGSIEDVLSAYSEVVIDQIIGTEKKEKKSDQPTHNTYAKITETYSLDESGKHRNRFRFGEDIYVGFKVSMLTPIANPVLGVTVWQKHTDKPIFASNTSIEGVKETGQYKKGETLSFKARIPDLINDGEYVIEPAITDSSTSVFYDQVRLGAKFYVSGSNNPNSLFSSKSNITLERVKK